MEETLTNEGLRKLFRDGFDLAHFAIRAGRKMIGHGDFALKDVLHWVATHPDEEDLQEFDQEEETEEEIEQG